MDSRNKNKEKVKVSKRENGITMIALVVTIIVLLILAVIGIKAITGEGIAFRAVNTGRNAERVSLIGSAKEDVSAKQIAIEESLLTKDELRDILNEYFEYVPNDYILDTELNTKDKYGDHIIKL